METAAGAGAIPTDTATALKQSPTNTEYFTDQTNLFEFAMDKNVDQPDHRELGHGEQLMRYASKNFESVDLHDHDLREQLQQNKHYAHRTFQPEVGQHDQVSDRGEQQTYPCENSFDFDILKKSLRKPSLGSYTLDESGYQSVLARSTHSHYGTGWMMLRTSSVDSVNSADDWDGYMNVGSEKVKIKEITELLASRYAFLSGVKSQDGLSVLTFPDIRHQLSFTEYKRLVTYLLQVPPLEDAYHGYVVIIDRRSDKWTSVKNLLAHISNYFPATLKIVYIVKPEGVLQRAFEVGYKTVLDGSHFPVVLCHTLQDLHVYIKPKLLTFDLGGKLKYNHLEWVQHRMDIERMRSTTQVIAQSLDEFSRCLKDTELGNDAETTQAIIDTQRSEKESIKEDFHIAVRRGLVLLKNIRQADVKPNAEQLSPTRLHNVTSIERMLIQLEETEQSFDKFWTSHEHRLQQCLQLRQFEDDFRKLQSNFAQHMLYMEEHREVGCTVDDVDTLIAEHKIYMEKAEDSVSSAEELKIRGDELMQIQEKELEGSLKPKCDELQRMKDALQGALQRRLDVLRLSKQMHEQISVANAWCCKGVELLTTLPMDVSSTEQSFDALKRLEDFLAVGNSLKLDSLRLNKGSADLKTLVLMITTDTSTLLQQVSARIADIKKMCENRKGFLQKNSNSTQTAARICNVHHSVRHSSMDKIKPVGTVSPSSSDSFKLYDLDTEPGSPDMRCKISPKGKLYAKSSLNIDKEQQLSPMERKYSLPVLNNDLYTPVSNSIELSPDHSVSPSTSGVSSNGVCVSASSTNNSVKAAYVIDELMTTEQIYVNELKSIIDFYMKPLESNKNFAAFVNQQHLIFGNISDLWHFHNHVFLKDLLKAGQQSPRYVARCFLEHRARFYLYVVYCQNKPRSETVRHEIGENHPFFQECQRTAGHRLPLGAYLLKPVQRITKYQLLLKELSKYCSDADYKQELDQAVDCMLDLLQQLNASMHQTHISGYPGDLANLGQAMMQGKFTVWHSRHSDKTLRLRRTGKAQQRHMFVYRNAIVFCKHRRQSPPYVQEYYEFKNELPICNITLKEHTKGNTSKFELASEGRQDVFILQPLDPRIRNDWVLKLKQLIFDSMYGPEVRARYERPVSWTSQTSSESSISSRDLSSNPDILERISPGDTNNNPPSPRSLPESNNGADDYSNGDYSDVDCLIIHTSEDQYRVAQDFFATNRDELSVRCGELVTILSKSDIREWVLVQKLNSTKRGWVPVHNLEYSSLI